MNSFELTNILLETTPFNKDVIGIITEFLENPCFKIGRIYSKICEYNDGLGGCVYFYKVMKRTKCFITFQKINDKYNTIQRLKIKYNDDYYNEEYVAVAYENLYSSNLFKDTYKIKRYEYTDVPYIDKSVVTIH
jgi:hypothetical protein